MGVEGCTNKDICVPRRKNTSHFNKHVRLFSTTYLITEKKVEAKYFLGTLQRSGVFEISSQLKLN